MFKDTLIKVLLITLFIKQLTWITFIPIWHTPDEQAHFAQVSVLGETNSLYIPEKNLSREIYESEKELGVLRDEFGNNKYTYHPNFNISYSTYTMGSAELKQISLPRASRTEFVISEAAWYPPLYYLAGSFFYKLFYNGSIFDRVFATRLLNLIFIVGLALVTLKIGELVFDKRVKAVFLAALVTFAPMVTFVYAGVTSDTFFILLFSLFLWRCLILIKEGITVKNIAIISIVISMSFYTKPQANIMALILAPIIFYLLLTKNRNSKSIFVGVAILAISSVEILFRLIKGAPLIPESGSALNVSVDLGLEHLRFTLNHTYREVLPWFWGVFRWLSLGLPELLRKVTNWLSIISLVGFILVVIRQSVRKKFDEVSIMRIFLFFALVVYFIALTVFDFGFRQSHGFSFGIQGRYFFPVIIPIMLILQIGLTELFPDKYHLKIGGILAILMIIFNVVVFFWVVGSYHEIIYPKFLIEASQYKPIWLKYPSNQFILLGFIISSFSLLAVILKRSYASKST